MYTFRLLNSNLNQSFDALHLITDACRRTIIFHEIQETKIVARLATITQAKNRFFLKNNANNAQFWS